MYKKIIYLCLAICFTLSLSGCKKDTMILFNSYPITKENILSNATEFPAGKRFYYIFITQSSLDTDMIRVRILKRDEKAQYNLVKLVYSNDFKLKKDQVYYYTDYMVMNQAGDYEMVIYARNRLNAPLATADFRIKN